MDLRSEAVRWIGIAVLCLAAASPIRGAMAAGRAADRSAPARPAVSLRLPADIEYVTAGKPDSAVVFRHGTHVALAGNRCTGCHPRPFPMLRRAPAPTHAAMAAGGSCGVCHDGRKAFGTRDAASCRACHSGPRPSRLAAAGAGAPAAAPALPRPHAFPPGADSPGRVTFRHATHARGAAGCGACHPRPFAMAAGPPRPGGAMHAKDACGRCHDGRGAFATDDTDACGRCHAGGGGS